MNKLLLILGIVLLLTGCTTPATNQARQDAKAIGQNTATIAKANRDAKDNNTTAATSIQNAQGIDNRIDAKDNVIDHAHIVP